MLYQDESSARKALGLLHYPLGRLPDTACSVIYSARVGRKNVYSSTRNRRSASTETVWTGIRIVFILKSPTLTSTYSAPPLPFKKSLFNLPILRPRGSRTQSPAHCFGASNRSTGHAPLVA